jgi:glycosyltransferase involved in cell wall biosynthesis
MSLNHGLKYRVLCLVSYYLPGYKAGGPLRTISNMVEHLGHEFEFWIITRDRDLGDALPYTGLTINRWISVGEARVYYISPDCLTLFGIARLINDTPHDLLYLNSFFDSEFTIKPLLARYLGEIKTKPVVLAPRGEFSKEALKLKALKKRAYIALFKLFGLCKNIAWQASSTHEMNDILDVLHINKDVITLALDLPAKISCQSSLYSEFASKKARSVKLIFLSRISPMKNLDYALKVLSDVHVSVVFDIYGPLEDMKYWELCKALIEKLPDNILCKYRGLVLPNEVGHVFSQYDLFLFPTQGESYGHVIAESLSVGTPVLISDKTPWRNLMDDNLGQDVSLDNTDKFVQFINKIAHATSEEMNNIREKVKVSACERLMDPEVIDTNKNLFLSAIVQKAKRP